MSWQKLGVEVDSERQLGCVVEWDAMQSRRYRFRFFRCDQSQVVTEDAYFDALEGDLEAIQELMNDVQVAVMQHAQQTSHSASSIVAND